MNKKQREKCTTKCVNEGSVERGVGIQNESKTIG